MAVVKLASQAQSAKVEARQDQGVMQEQGVAATAQELRERVAAAQMDDSEERLSRQGGAEKGEVGVAAGDTQGVSRVDPGGGGGTHEGQVVAAEGKVEQKGQGGHEDRAQHRAYMATDLEGWQVAISP